MERTETYVKGRDQLRQSKIVLAKHFQRLERCIGRPILEFQGNDIISGGILGEFESNSGSIVGCVQ